MSQSNTTSEIPSRVESLFRLTLGKSTIAGAGRGLFVCEPVPSQALIFRVARPLICIVEEDEALRRICDNCFGHERGKFQTTRHEIIEISPCPTCEILYYCSEECRDSAWQQYHKAECRFLSSIRQDPNDGAAVMSKSMRTLVRLLSLHEYDLIPGDEWDEYISLKTLRGTGREKWEDWAGIIAQLAIRHGVTTLDEKVVKQLVFALFNNNLSMEFPVLQDAMKYPAGNGGISSGTCLEPFASMINHSCNPNSWWTFNGRELQIRALRDIPAGEELTISYVNISSSFNIRQESLLTNWGFNCLCSLCEMGQLGPTEEHLRTKLWGMCSQEQATNKFAPIEVYQYCIDHILEAGYSIGTWPVRHLYRQVFRVQLNSGERIEAAKTFLKYYYQIQPVSFPRFFPGDRVHNLKKLLSLIRTLESSESPLVTEEVREIIPHVLAYLSRRLCRQTKNCYGAGTEIAEFEKEQFQKYFGRCNDALNNRMRYKHNVKVLLDWAGVSNVPESDL